MVPYGTIWYHVVPYGTLWYLTVPFFPCFNFHFFQCFFNFSSFHFPLLHFFNVPFFQFSMSHFSKIFIFFNFTSFDFSNSQHVFSGTYLFFEKIWYHMVPYGTPHLRPTLFGSIFVRKCYF